MSNGAKKFKEATLKGVEYVNSLEAKIEFLELEVEATNNKLASSKERAESLEKALEEALMYNRLYGDKITRLKAEIARGARSEPDSSLFKGCGTGTREVVIKASDDSLAEKDIRGVLKRGTRIDTDIKEVESLNEKIMAKLKKLAAIDLGANVDTHA